MKSTGSADYHTNANKLPRPAVFIKLGGRVCSYPMLCVIARHIKRDVLTSNMLLLFTKNLPCLYIHMHIYSFTATTKTKQQQIKKESNLNENIYVPTIHVSSVYFILILITKTLFFCNHHKYHLLYLFISQKVVSLL